MGNNSSRQDAYKVDFHSVQEGEQKEQKQLKQQKCNLDECQQKLMEILTDSGRKQEKQQLFKLLAAFNLQGIIDTKLRIIRDVTQKIKTDCEQTVKDVCLERLNRIENPAYILSTTLDDITIENLLTCCEIKITPQSGEAESDKPPCDEIGKGSFGRVYENPKGKEKVVYKVFINEENSREEIAFNSNFKTNNEMKKYALLGELTLDLTCKPEGKKIGSISLEIPKCTNILKDYLHTDEYEKKKNTLKLSIIENLCDCVEGFHTASGGYCHNDIKPDNICVTHSEDTTDTTRVQNVKLIDFGTCSTTPKIGTIEYSHPMHIFNLNNNCKIGEKKYDTDWWSVGLVCYEIYNNGKHLFEWDAKHDQQLVFIFISHYKEYILNHEDCTYQDITDILKNKLLDQPFTFKNTTTCEKIKELFEHLLGGEKLA